MSPYDFWKTFDVDGERAQERGEAFDEEMRWPSECDECVQFGIEGDWEDGE